ncbi:MAG: ribosome biogenesis GTPase Der [bacterium]
MTKNAISVPIAVLPTVVIVGRPNVGKSTLFNRLVGRRDAIVDDQPGVTRDAKERPVTWTGRDFLLVDTGGLFGSDDDPFSPVVQAKIEDVVSDASVLLFVLDARDGPTPIDHRIMHWLRCLRQTMIVVVNKVDNPSRQDLAMAFYELGCDSLYPISSIHGIGTGDLLDKVVELLPPPAKLPVYDENVSGIAIVGRPNVGKSTLLNQLVGQERAIVSPIPGTTRDPVDTLVEYEGKPYLLVDTAGIRRRAKMHKGLDRFALMRGREAIERSDVALLLVDAEEGLTETDARVFSYSHDAGKAAIVVVNKWDVVERTSDASGKFVKHLREEMPFLSYAPILFISALSGYHIQKIFPEVQRVLEGHRLRPTTSELNRILEEILLYQPPPSRKGREVKAYYWTQVSTGPPTIVLFVNDPDLVHFSYRRYLTNRLYERFGFYGTPIRLVLRARRQSK